ncbi:MAG: hypothetical protein WD875_09335 [Pirellulales bacterium]
MLADARKLGVHVQVNTTISQRNVHQVDAIADLLGQQGIMMWSVFFLIPVGRGLLETRISPEDYEVVFEKLWLHSQRQPYAIKTTEAPHYRRFVMERNGDPLAGSKQGPASQRRHVPLGIGDGKGIMFVSHTGEIYPAGFLPLRCGRFPNDSVVEAYQQHPTFRALRRPDEFGGKCGSCDYRDICGGSRSRAFAVTGDPLAAEPDCVFESAAVA